MRWIIDFDQRARRGWGVVVAVAEEWEKEKKMPVVVVVVRGGRRHHHHHQYNHLLSSSHLFFLTSLVLVSWSRGLLVVIFGDNVLKFAEFDGEFNEL